MKILLHAMLAMAAWVAPVTVSASHAPGHALDAKAQLPLVAGEVRRVDREGGRITLKHEAIPNLGMDGMTMVFRAESALLDKVKAGDKVKFRADTVKGKMTVTEIVAVR